MKLKSRKSGGISLISLIITIIVIIILAAIVIFSGMDTPEKAQLSKVISDIDNVQTAVDQAYYGLYTEKAVAGEVWTKSQFYEAVATGKTNREDLTATGLVEISEDSLVGINLPVYEGRKWYVAVSDVSDTVKVGSAVLSPGFESQGKTYVTLLDVQNGGSNSSNGSGTNSGTDGIILKESEQKGGVSLLYEVIEKSSYTTVVLYPRIEGSDTYIDYALDILKGKSEAEIVQIFVEGENYWRGTDFNSISELIEYLNDNYCDSYLTGTIENLCSYFAFPSLIAMAIDWQSVKPDGYDWDKTENVIDYTIYDEYNENNTNGSTSTSYLSYTCFETGNYKYTLKANSVETSINVNVSTNPEDMFLTDGNGTLLGLNSEYYLVGVSCYRYTYITDLIIPEKIGNETIRTIGESAFSGLHGVKNINLPDTVIKIDNFAFDGCESLTSIIIPNSVTSIGGSAFSACESLTSITIPSGVTSIGNHVFRYCRSLTSIIIPNSVTSIGNDAFIGCESLTSITIPSGVTSIENSVFSDCSSLASIIIPNSVTSIGDSAFYGCSSLASIIIPNSVTSIEGYAFGGCSSLASITIPNSVTSIGTGAFWDCGSLTSITIESGSTLTVPDYKWGASNATIVYE